MSLYSWKRFRDFFDLLTAGRLGNALSSVVTESQGFFDFFIEVGILFCQIIFGYLSSMEVAKSALARPGFVTSGKFISCYAFNVEKLDFCPSRELNLLFILIGLMCSGDSSFLNVFSGVGL